MRLSLRKACQPSQLRLTMSSRAKRGLVLVKVTISGSEIKVLAVLAGLLPRWQPSKSTIATRQDRDSTSLSRSWLIATDQVVVAAAATRTRPLNTSTEQVYLLLGNYPCRTQGLQKWRYSKNQDRYLHDDQGLCLRCSSIRSFQGITCLTLNVRYRQG